jgi:adenosylhomocysteine nucleosidase
LNGLIAPIGLMTPMAEERHHLSLRLTDPSQRTFAGRRVLCGWIGDKEVILAESGVGKVASAATATLLIHGLGCRAVIVAGVAGGVDPIVEIGDVVIADRLIQHDYGSRTAEGLRHYRPGLPPLGPLREDIEFRLDPGLLDQLRSRLMIEPLPKMPAELRGTGKGDVAPKLLFGPIVSGDQFINHDGAREELRRRHNALAVEMEGAAVAQVADLFGVPCIVARSVSDLAGAQSHLDFAKFLDSASPIAAEIVARIVAIV